MKRLISTLLLMALLPSLFAQEADMATLMRSEGKIYVVVGVVVLIFAVLFTYLIFLDLRLKKIEKSMNKS